MINENFKSIPESESAEFVEEIKKKAISGAFSYFLRTLFLQAIGFASIIILSKYFSPEDFGIYGIIVQIIGILIFFSDVGLAASLIQKKAEPEVNEYRTAFTVQFVLSVFIFASTILLGQNSAVVAKLGSSGIMVLYALGLSFPLATLKTIPSVILERKLNFSKVVLPQIFEQLAFHGILIFLALKGAGVEAYAYAVLVRSVIGVIIMWIIQPWSVGLHFEWKILKSQLNFGAKFQINDLLARVKDQLFYLVIGIFLPTAQFGYIQWAKNWSMYPYNLTVQNVMAITFPSFSRLQEHPLVLKKAIEKSLFFITLVIFPMLVGMSVFIIPLLKVVPGFDKWLPAAASLIFFSLSIAWAAVSTPLTNALNALGKINWTLKLMILWTSLTWLITPVAVLLTGFNGVAIAALIISFSSYLSVWYVQKLIPFEFFENIWRQLLASFAMAFVGIVGLTYWQQSWLLLLCGMMISSVVYLTTTFLVGKTKLQTELASFNFKFLGGRTKI
jgi:O-antigen/teichoic acid export membrane protein